MKHTFLAPLCPSRGESVLFLNVKEELCKEVIQIHYSASDTQITGFRVDSYYLLCLNAPFAESQEDS